jgi:hypothetical protein
MNPIQELRAMLVKPVLQTSGTVIEVLRSQTYRVRTAAGSMEVKAVGNAAYAIGAEVLVRNGIIQGRIKSETTVPTYSV